MTNPPPPPSSVTSSVTLRRVEELGAMEKKATAGPWKGDGPYTGSVWAEGQSSWVIGDGRTVDAEFIAALRNEATALLRAARDAVAMREALEEIAYTNCCDCSGPVELCNCPAKVARKALDAALDREKGMR